MYITKIATEENIFKDNIAKVELWDFSRANINDTSRIEAITTVASVCYDNPNVIGKESLYNRLAGESKGLPSSSFEFVPVLIPLSKIDALLDLYTITYAQTPSLLKYSEVVSENNIDYLLTNYRTLYYDYEAYGKNPNILQVYNTEEECKIIAKYQHTFLSKIDIATSKQHNRHRVSLQELSRRYVSGKKTEFEFYYSKNLDNVGSLNKYIDVPDDIIDEQFSTRDLTQLMVDHYFTALKQGVKPQEARRILPQSMYTTIWSAFMPSQLRNYYNLRDDPHAQTEIRWLAQAMKRLTGD